MSNFRMDGPIMPKIDFQRGNDSVASAGPGSLTAESQWSNITVMRAIVRSRTGVSVQAVPRPMTERDDDVLVRVAVAGVCRTDLYVADGSIASSEGRILGHECAGVVEEVGHAVPSVRAGHHVTIMPMISCGRCEQCIGNAETVCVARSMLGVDRDGAFAEFVVVPAKAVYRIPDSMPFNVAAYSEPVAAALAVLKAEIRPEQRGLIYGHSRFSTLVSRLLLARGFSRLECFDPRQDGASLASNAYDFVIETVATPAALRQMVRAIKPRGTVVFKSRTPLPVSIDFGLAVAKELIFRAVSYGSFREAIGLLAERLIQLDDLLGDVYRLDDFEQVFLRAREDESTKLFFSPGGEHVRGR